MKKKKIHDGIVYLWNGMFLFLGAVIDTAFHQHNAVQLVLGLDGAFTIETNNGRYSTSAVLLDSNVAHRLRGDTRTQALLLLENGSETASRFKRILNNQDLILFSENDRMINSAIEFQRIFLENLCINSVAAYLTELFRELFEQPDEIKSIDSRIVKAKAIIEQMDEKKVFAHEIAEELYLSETRFIHLFKQETGLPFRRYVLWKRMLDSIKVLIDTGDITQAAHEAGFADSAHLARTFKVNFGITLSEIFKNDRFVQVNSSTFN